LCCSVYRLCRLCCSVYRLCRLCSVYCLCRLCCSVYRLCRLCCSVYCLCVNVYCTVCVLPPAVNPVAVNKYIIISYQFDPLNMVTCYRSSKSIFSPHLFHSPRLSVLYTFYKHVLFLHVLYQTPCKPAPLIKSLFIQWDVTWEFSSLEF
jgi:hypothetical protein